jgi:pimeloyl-ACP methyl ester carboxylesterase
LVVRVDIGDGVRLFVDIDGPGLVADGPVMRDRPTLLLVHGGPAMDSSVFRGSGLDELTDVAQVVCYDNRGAGRSDWRSPDEWALDTWADDVVRLCDALGIVEPVVLGSSFGGMVAQRYLARHPGHPGRVILAGTAARLDLDLVAAAFAARGGEHAAEIARCYLAGDQSRADDYDRVCLPLYATTPVEATRFARVVVNPDLSGHFKREWNTIDLRPGLAAVECPVLVVGGELDPICPVPAVDEIVKALPPQHVRFVELAGASHMEAAADGIAALVREFLGELTDSREPVV